jgi:pimeloyl-ACP methyl ester carboxylesterase
MKYTTAMFAGDAAAILDELDAEQAIVCGHSNGGRVVQTLALDYPRKVSKLILGFEWIVVLGDQRHSLEALSGYD